MPGPLRSGAAAALLLALGAGPLSRVAWAECGSDCYTTTCDYWDGGYWGTCDTLKSAYGCDCTDCECDGCPQSSCDNPRFDVSACHAAGNGECDFDLNTADCAYDGGDCCKTTCIGNLCGTQGYDCQDPGIKDKDSDRPEPGAAPASTPAPLPASLPAPAPAPAPASDQAGACPWVGETTNRNDVVQCEDGSVVADYTCAKADHGQRTKCSLNKPLMCAARTCGGGLDYCCEETCDELGGPRPCEETKDQGTDSKPDQQLGGFTSGTAKPVTTTGSSRSSTAADEDDGPRSHVWLLTAGVVGVLICAILAVLLLRPKERQLLSNNDARDPPVKLPEGEHSTLAGGGEASAQHPLLRGNPQDNDDIE